MGQSATNTAVDGSVYTDNKSEAMVREAAPRTTVHQQVSIRCYRA